MPARQAGTGGSGRRRRNTGRFALWRLSLVEVQDQRPCWQRYLDWVDDAMRDGWRERQVVCADAVMNGYTRGVRDGFVNTDWTFGDTLSELQRRRWQRVACVECIGGRGSVASERTDATGVSRVNCVGCVCLQQRDDRECEGRVEVVALTPCVQIIDGG